MDLEEKLNQVKIIKLVVKTTIHASNITFSK